MSVLPQVSRIMSPGPRLVEDDPQAVILTTVGELANTFITTPFCGLAASFTEYLGFIIGAGRFNLPKVWGNF